MQAIHLTKFDKYGMLDFEGMPETVGGRFLLPEGSDCYDTN